MTETIGAQQFNAVSRASASLAVANAELKSRAVAWWRPSRASFTPLRAADRRVAVAQRAADEAAGLTKLTQQREAGREVAHADVVKAQLQQQQRDRDLVRREAARQRRPGWNSACCSFPIRAPLHAGRAGYAARRCRRGPMWKLRSPSTILSCESALASSHLADLNVFAARVALSAGASGSTTATASTRRSSPINAPDGSRNLGYSASATLNIPVWDWFTTRDKVRQSEISRTAAKAAAQQHPAQTDRRRWKRATPRPSPRTTSSTASTSAWRRRPKACV